MDDNRGGKSREQLYIIVGIRREAEATRGVVGRSSGFRGFRSFDKFNI